jgi:predicted RNA binding protein YcfA (HicA-like mRNA interferase family)
MNSREVLRRLREHGWVPVRQRGSHVQLKHPVRKGIVTVKHPAKNYPVGTLHSIERQSGVPLRSEQR